MLWEQTHVLADGSPVIHLDPGKWASKGQNFWSPVTNPGTNDDLCLIFFLCKFAPLVNWDEAGTLDGSVVLVGVCEAFVPLSNEEHEQFHEKKCLPSSSHAGYNSKTIAQCQNNGMREDYLRIIVWQGATEALPWVCRKCLREVPILKTQLFEEKEMQKTPSHSGHKDT